MSNDFAISRKLLNTVIAELECTTSDEAYDVMGKNLSKIFEDGVLTRKELHLILEFKMLVEIADAKREKAAEADAEKELRAWMCDHRPPDGALYIDPEADKPKRIQLRAKQKTVSLEDAQKLCRGYVEMIDTPFGQILVDEEALLKNPVPKLNSIASLLAERPIHGPAIVLLGEARWS